MTTVREAFMALLGRCDGAVTRDHQGFNGRDAPFAHSLGDWEGKWTPNQERSAHKMLKTYRVQLEGLGFDYSNLEKESQDTGGVEVQTFENHYGLKILLKFPYNAGTVRKIKDLPWEETHRRWNPELEGWELDANTHSAEALVEIGFSLPPRVLRLCGENVVEGEATDIEVIVHGASSRIRGAPKSVLKAIDQRLRFQPDGFDFVPSYQSGEWDGYIHLFKHWNGTFPTGLLTMVVEVLEGIKLEKKIKLTDERIVSDKIDLEWYGFDLRQYQRDALDKALMSGGGVINMPTGSGKTLLALKLVQELLHSAVVLVHRKELLYQWAKCVREYLHVEPGMVGDGLHNEKDITIAMLHTLKTKPLRKHYDIMIADECHHISAETFQESASRIGSKYRFGLSATPRREDNKDLMIWAQTGEIVADVTITDLVEDGFLARPRFLTLKYDGYYGGGKFAQEYRQMVECPERNEAIVDLVVRKHIEGYRIYVDVKRIKHGKAIAQTLNERGISAIFISGSTSTERRQQVLKSFEADGFVLVSTLIKEGVDLPAMSMIVLAGGGKSGTMVIQTIGRALRPKPGTNEALVVDLTDTGFYTKKHFNQRQSIMRVYYGDLFDPEEVE